MLVVGSGIAGMQSAILLAEAGHRVFLVDSQPSIGGSLHLLDNTFPTDSCGICMMLPGRAAYCPSIECSLHENIQLLSNSEIGRVSGRPGDLKVSVCQKPRFVSVELCNNCGICSDICPEYRPHQFEGELAPQKAIYAPPPRSVPNTYVVDMARCTLCGKCVDACPESAIDLGQEAKSVELAVGAVILSPGFKPFDPRLKGEYGFGHYDNVLTSLQYERMSSYSGSTGAAIRRPSDGKKPRRIAFISCVGSRDPSLGRGYCSSVCCMYTAKLVRVSRRRDPELEMTVFYMDTRAMGKGYERYLCEAQEAPGVRYVRCMPSHVREVPGSGDLRVQYATYDEGGRPRVVEQEYDLVVLAVGLDPADDTDQLATLLGLDLNAYRFGQAAPFEPVGTRRPGVFVAGSFREPKDIPETVVEASGAAASAAGFLARLGHSVARSGDTVETPVERDVADDQARIGVLVSQADYAIDVRALVNDAGSLSGVVLAEVLADPLSREGQRAIGAAIEKHDLNRLVVAAGSPRSTRPVLETVLRRSGLNPLYLEVANIREQAARPGSSKENGRLQAKARDAIRMAVAKVTRARAAIRVPATIVQRVLVLGGGVAGMTAALSLSELGFEVVLVESTDRLGGNLRQIHVGFDGSEPQEYLRAVIGDVRQADGIAVLLNTELTSLGGHLGAFVAQLSAKDGSTRVLEHGALIVATGGREAVPTEYGYGRLPGVMTQREYEQLLSGTADQRPGEAAESQRIVMIQCVGSRDEKHAYCSRVCCAQAVKNAIETKKHHPETAVTVLYRDMRTYGFREDLYRQAREMGVDFFEYDVTRKPRVTSENGGLRVQICLQPDAITVNLDVDMVVLSVGAEPSAGSSALSVVTDLPLDGDGFFLEANPKMRPLDFAREGAYVCGLARSPCSVDEAVAQGRAAAMRAAVALHRDKREIGANIAVVNPRLCSACGICVDVCPFGARVLPGEHGHYAHVVDVLCQGCGVCVAACPNNACQLEGHRVRQLMDVIDAALVS